MSNNKNDKEDVSINAPVAEAYAEAISPTIQAIRQELEVVIKVSWKIYFSLVIIIIEIFYFFNFLASDIRSINDFAWHVSGENVYK